MAFLKRLILSEIINLRDKHFYSEKSKWLLDSSVPETAVCSIIDDHKAIVMPESVDANQIGSILVLLILEDCFNLD